LTRSTGLYSVASLKIELS